MIQVGRTTLNIDRRFQELNRLRPQRVQEEERRILQAERVQEEERIREDERRILQAERVKKEDVNCKESGNKE